jgi:hypothetical protein
MQRRDAIKKTALFIGSIAIAPEILARALSNPAPTLARLPADRLALLAEMADTIIPDTDSPGAKAARVQDYIAVIVEDCFPPERRPVFWSGLEATEKQCVAFNGKSFVDCTAAQRTAFFQKLEAEQRNGDSFWRQLKGLTINGYFSSEIGATQALRYDPVPGGWIPDMPADADAKAWTPVF